MTPEEKREARAAARMPTPAAPISLDDLAAFGEAINKKGAEVVAKREAEAVADAHRRGRSIQEKQELEQAVRAEFAAKREALAATPDLAINDDTPTKPADPATPEGRAELRAIGDQIRARHGLPPKPRIAPPEPESKPGVVYRSYSEAYEAVMRGRVERAVGGGAIVERIFGPEGSAIATFGVDDSPEEIAKHRAHTLAVIAQQAAGKAKRKQAESAAARATHRMRVASDIVTLLVTRIDLGERDAVLDLARAALPR